MFPLPGQYYIIHQVPGYGNIMGRQWFVTQAFNLCYDDATVVSGRLCDWKNLSNHSLFRYGQVAFGISLCRTNQPNIDGEGVVAEPRPASQFNPLHKVLARPCIQFASLMKRVDESAQAHMCDTSRASRGDVP